MGEFFVRRPIVAMVISIIICILGYLAMQKTPVAQYPDIVPPLVKITTSFTGANALNVEQAVATPIEQKVNGVENMLYMKSINTSDGALTIEVTFDVGTDLDNANMLTQNKEKQAEPFLPQSVKQQGVSIKKSLSFPMLLFTITSKNPKYDAKFLNNYASINIVDALARIRGVGEVTLFGSDYSMRIWLNASQMTKLGVTVSEVKNALNSQNMISPGGKFGAEPAPPGTEFTYSATLQDRLVTEKQFEGIIVRSKEDGSQVLLGDIARIELGTENYSSIVRKNGQAAAAIAIYQMPGSNALEVAEKAKTAMKEMSERFPKDIEYQESLDTTLAITEGITDIIHTLFEAILLVILVVFIFLQNWRATLIPLITVPVSLLGAIAVFPLLGFSINTLSLLGLVLAIGIVVDDAIVVVEAVMHHIEHGKTPKEATIQAMKEVSGPVMAIALILIAVFVPVAMTPGLTGRFYQQFALTIAGSVAFTAFSALSLSPALCAMLLKPTKPLDQQKGILPKFYRGFNKVFDKATNGYLHGAGFFAKKSIRIVALLGLVIVIAGFLGIKVPSGFIPEEDMGYILVNINTPPASSLQRTDEVTHKVESILAKEDDILAYTTINGFSLLTGSYLPSNGFIFVSLKEWGERPGTTAKQLAAKLNKIFGAGITNATVMAFGPPAIQGLGASAGFSMMLQDRGGNTPQYLEQQTKAFIAAAQKRPEIKRIYSTFNAGSPQFKLEIDNEKAMKLGVPVSTVTEALGAFLGANYVNDFNRFGRQYKVFLQAEGQDRLNPDALQQMSVKNSKGDMVPLSTLVTVTKVTGPDFTNRLNLFRAAEIGGEPADGFSSSQALNALEEVAKEVLPSTMSYDYINLSYQEKHSPGGASVFIMALVFVFLILAAQYESWKLPFSVLLGTPFAVFGAFLGLFLARFANDAYVINVFAQIGLVMLIGLAAKNAILIVEFAKSEQEKGVPLMEAAMTSAKLRFRPILMTAFAFILGVVPLLTATGAGSQARIVMGMAVFAGMLIATVLGVFSIPALFVMIENMGKKKDVVPEVIKNEEGK
ncbi:MAG TPA: efflux RND transporter permease subunit [Bacteroidales bacterium]|nr:efflux RND transporter permease subunit [Bacteroidales bacterium]